MKKLTLFLVILVFLIGCQYKYEVIDQTSYHDTWEARLISYGKDHGEILQVKVSDGDFDLDISDLKPWKVDLCNIDGLELELALGVYKASPHHKDQARRVFFYNIDFENKRLKPKLRVSRLSNPMVDYIINDIDCDNRDEIISIERTLDKKVYIGAYKWTNWAFERSYKSRALDQDLAFVAKEGQVTIGEDVYMLYLQGDEIKWK